METPDVEASSLDQVLIDLAAEADVQMIEVEGRRIPALQMTARLHKPWTEELYQEYEEEEPEKVRIQMIPYFAWDNRGADRRDENLDAGVSCGKWKKGESMSQNEQEILWKDRKHHLWFPISFTKYYITGGRLHIKKGLLSTIHDETILYRVTDITLKRTLAHRIFGTGTIILKVQADAIPVQSLENIKYPEDVRTFLSELVDQERAKRNVDGQGDVWQHGNAPWTWCAS